MVTALAQANAHDVAVELDWLAQVLASRFATYFAIGGGGEPAGAPPARAAGTSPFAASIVAAGLDATERTILALALAAHLRPRLLDPFHTRNVTFDRRFTEFGGIRPGGDGDFWPSGETAAFVAGGDDLAARFDVMTRLLPESRLVATGLLRLSGAPDEDMMRGALRLTPETLDRVTFGTVRAPDLGAGFPAQRIRTELDWDDLVLHPATLAQVREIEAWLAHGATLMHDWGMARTLRPGYRVLFHGPPGTGKTMTACLLGRATARDVYRIDLSMTVSKFIGETEKNLSRVFDAAQARGWILFFDEADALFGKRSDVKDAHDRYANQEVSYLLQRIERFDGVAILASNLRDNLDDAFARRFESMIFFPMPRAEERAILWRKAMPARATLAPDLDLDAIGRDHPLSGGGIMNAVRYAAIAALADGDRPIGHAHMLHAIRRELVKEGRSA